MELRHADGKVPVGEFVWYIEAQRAELAPFHQDRVEQAERESQGLEAIDLRVLRIEEVRHFAHLSLISAQDVSLKW